MPQLLRKLSPGKTIISLLLALGMFKLSAWQWERYKYKVALVASYKINSSAAALPFPAQDFAAVNHEVEDSAAIQSVLHKKVHLAGTFDFSKQLIVTNRINADGPGHVLFAPLRLDGIDRTVWVGRGFIPFADRDPESWLKYDTTPHVEFDAVVQEARTPSAFGPTNPEPTAEQPIVRTWYFEEIGRMAAMYPQEQFLTSVFVQQLGGPANGRYPEQAVTIQVPPSTHFGYTIEWAFLGVLTLVLSFILQVFFLNRNKGQPHASVEPEANGARKVRSAG